MERNTRLRRVVIVCEQFSRNLAFYRAGWDGSTFKLSGEFWKTANSAFLDICILEWCKLLGDKRGKHDWRKIYPDHKAFKREMFSQLSIKQTDIDKIEGSIRHYRDKFVAHLDSDETMKIPLLGLAKETVEFYHSKVISECQGTTVMNGRVTDLSSYYDACYQEALKLYSRQ